MDTVWHAFWTYIIFRKRKYVPLTVIGAILPDTANLIAIGLNFLLYGFTWETYQAPKIPQIALYANYTTHSLLIILLGSILCFFLARKFIPLFYGIGLHALVDYATHHSDAYVPFFPVSLVKFPSPVSYWETAYHSTGIMIVNIVLASIALFYLIRTLRAISKTELGLFAFSILYLGFLSWFYFVNHRSYELVVNGLLPLLLFGILLWKGLHHAWLRMAKKSKAFHS